MSVKCSQQLLKHETNICEDISTRRIDDVICHTNRFPQGSKTNKPSLQLTLVSMLSSMSRSRSRSSSSTVRGLDVLDELCAPAGLAGASVGALGACFNLLMSTSISLCVTVSTSSPTGLRSFNSSGCWLVDTPWAASISSLAFLWVLGCNFKWNGHEIIWRAFQNKEFSKKKVQRESSHFVCPKN